MYFWNINKLKEDLKKGPLAEKSAFKYFFTYILLFSIATFPSSEPTEYNFYSTLSYSIVGLVGLYYAYKLNGGAQGKDFVIRYLAIGWVASLRWMVMVFIPFLIGLTIYKVAAGTVETTIMDDILFNLVCITLYWKIGQHLKEISEIKKESIQ